MHKRRVSFLIYCHPFLDDRQTDKSMIQAFLIEKCPPSTSFKRVFFHISWKPVCLGSRREPERYRERDRQREPKRWMITTLAKMMKRPRCPRSQWWRWQRRWWDHGPKKTLCVVQARAYIIYYACRSKYFHSTYQLVTSHQQSVDGDPINKVFSSTISVKNSKVKQCYTIDQVLETPHRSGTWCN